MKKIFTLLFAIGMLGVAQAQYDQRNYPQNDQRNYPQNDQWKNPQNDQRDFNNNNFGGYGHYDNRNLPFDRDRDMQIARINQKYEFKIQMVQRNFFMGWFEKKRQIRFLQEQRQREISMVYHRGYDRRDRWDDHDRDRW